MALTPEQRMALEEGRWQRIYELEQTAERYRKALERIRDGDDVERFRSIARAALDGVGEAT